MLEIYPVILQFVADAAPLIRLIARHDPNLARQLRDASTSVALNVAEAMYARGASKAHRYNLALCEMSESRTALEVAERLEYIAPLAPVVRERVQRIVGTLVRLSFPKRA